jgi:hypothetical protein
MIEVPVNKDDIQQCLEFAEKVNKTTFGHYKNRSQSNYKKQQRDHLVGKLAEYSVARYFNTPFPDVGIYRGRKKSFNADLQMNDGTLLHVKAQSSEASLKYGVSWVFQLGGQGFGHTDPIVLAPSGMICFVSVNLDEEKSCIHALINSQDCIPGLLKHPKLKYLIGKKTCIYYDDLLNTFGKEKLCSDILAANRKFHV